MLFPQETAAIIPFLAFQVVMFCQFLDVFDCRSLKIIYVTLAILSPLASPAEAGVVYGRVSAEGVKDGGAELEVLDARGNLLPIRVKSDRDGNYSVNLPPGIYKVRLKNDPRWEGRIWSYDRPVKQDIFLKQPGAR